MDYLKDLKKNELALIIYDEEKEKDVKDIINEQLDSWKLCGLKKLSGEENKSQSMVTTILPLFSFTQENVKKIFDILEPGGFLVIGTNKQFELKDVEFILKTNGFTNFKTVKDNVTCYKPKYEVGSSAKLNLKKPAAVWKLEDMDEDVIDADNLLDEDDFKKPEASTLKVCGTTGKRKACKDCSCGLAEELMQEGENGNVVDTTNAPKSSCGSCYLGDAFRCASCPFLGMPAFKPGEKIQLVGNQLEADN